MSSSASLKDLCKAVNAYIPDPTLPLPDTLVQVIDGYLTKHEKYDESNSEKLQDELFIIFNKHVKTNPKTYAPWLSILRRLYPVIYTQERLSQWFEACEGFIDEAPLDKALATETSAALLDTVDLVEKYEEAGNDDPNCLLLDRLLSMWLNRFYPNSLKGSSSNAGPNEKLIRDGLVQFGKKRPKEFFTSVDKCLLQKPHRTATLRLFCDYIQSRPPHLHKILDSTLFTHLLTCLQLDTSTTTVSAALIALIMLLPHFPSSLVPHLPVLFNIYARLLFWRQERSGVSIPPVNLPQDGKPWDVSEFIEGKDESSIAHIDGYYTILYGLYPINFMDFIRKPQRYLRHCQVTNAEEVEIQPTELRHHSEKFRQLHVLHPNFYTLTIESEIKDFGRWIKSEAADVAAECMSLSLSSSENAGLYLSAPCGHTHPTSEDPVTLSEGADPALLSSSVDQDEPSGLGLIPAVGVEASESEETAASPTEETVPDSTLSPRAPSVDVDGPGRDTNSPVPSLRQASITSPTIGSGLDRSPSQTRLQNLMRSSSPILPSSQSSKSLSSRADNDTRIAYLQRQVLLLQNDLSFERYQKQQHMAHIGDLRRRLVSEAASEAETQNLILTNRGLKTRFEEAKKAEMQIRKEAEKSRTMAKKRENDVSTRVQKLREDSKRMQSELTSLRTQLEEARSDNEKLRNFITENEVRELKIKQDMQWNEIQMKEHHKLKAELDRLMLFEREAQGKEQEMQQAIIEAQSADVKSESLKLELAGSRDDHQKTVQMYEAQTAALKKELQAVQLSRDRLPLTAALPSAEGVKKSLEASRAKMTSMQESYDRLSKKYAACQRELFDLQASRPFHPPNKADLGSSPDSTDEPSYLSMSPSSFRRGSRPQRILSETNMSEISASSHHRAHRLGSINDEDIAGDQASPERSFFRRGSSQLQLMAKGKVRDESPAGGPSDRKKEKKSGLRGIRGLV